MCESVQLGTYGIAIQPIINIPIIGCIAIPSSVLHLYVTVSVYWHSKSHANFMQLQRTTGLLTVNHFLDCDVMLLL